MDDWRGLRIALVVVVWVTVGGGALLGTIWSVRGGHVARGAEHAAAPGVRIPAGDDPRVTSFSSAQVGIHGLLGVLTAALVTYGAVRTSDRGSGYPALLVAIAITAIPGALMFLKWRRNRRTASRTVSSDDEHVEDRLPAPVVYFHGVGALATAMLVVLLALAD
jgi:hypothetical protein